MDTHPHHLLSRVADGSPLSDGDRRDLEAHLDRCAECRDDVEAQRLVSQALRARIEVPAPSDFSARLAARIDAGQSSPGMLDLANWRAWTVGLAPLAAGLVLMAYLGVGMTPAASTSTVTTSTATETAATFDTWTSASAGSTPAAVFLQPNASSDQLLETVLTGTVPAPGDSSNVR